MVDRQGARGDTGERGEQGKQGPTGPMSDLTPFQHELGSPYRIALVWFLLAFLFFGTAIVAARQIMVMERQAAVQEHAVEQDETDKELNVRLRVLEIQHGIPHVPHTNPESK